MTLDVEQTPERIWLTGFSKDQYGAKLGRGTVSDLDHGDNPDYPPYVRADIHEAAAARIAELKEKLKAAVDDAKAAEDYAEELEAKLAKATEYMSQAHAVMRACGWQDAPKHQTHGDGVLELAAAEVEEKFRVILEGDTK